MPHVRHVCADGRLQVRDALLHPETRERLAAVRRWAEAQRGAPFPPSPVGEDEAAAYAPGGPLYGQLSAPLAE